MSDEILALVQLQKLVNHAVQPEFTQQFEFDHEELIKMFKLEKYLEHAKQSRKDLDEFLEAPEWAERRQALDSKIAVIESILDQKRKQYANFLMDQQRRAQGDREQIEKLSKPMDFSQFIQPESSPESTAETMATPTLPDLPLNERSQLLRRRVNPKGPTESPTSDSPYRKEHDEAAADLVALAKNLKQNNLAFQRLLKEDERTVKESELLLNSTSSKFQKEHGKLKTFRASSWRSTKTTIMMMFLLFIGFIFMYLFIKFT